MDRRLRELHVLQFLNDRKDLFEGGGERRLEGLELAGSGMRKREEAGVERQAAEGVGLGAVFLITHNGTPEAG